METLHHSTISSLVGPLTLVVSTKGLMRLDFGKDVWINSRGGTTVNLVESKEAIRPYVEELERYFRGELKEFTLPLDLRGTEFQKKCWQELLRIPYGKTRTYAQIARAVGSPNACRAVGGANHHNPVAIIVPCHRVVASGGKLGGYGGGLDIKQKLLELEGEPGRW